MAYADRERTEPRIIFVSGESGSGKTTVCQKVIRRCRKDQWDIAGILSKPYIENDEKTGIMVTDLRTNHEKPLASLENVYEGTKTGRWYFSEAGLEFGAKVLRQAIPCDIFVVDEIGPMEAYRSEGWAFAFDELKSADYRVALVTVRPELIDVFNEKTKPIKSGLVNITVDTRDEAEENLYQLIKNS